MLEEIVYICFSKYGKYKQQCKFNSEKFASAVMVRDKSVQLLLTEYASREKMFSLLKKKRNRSDFMESYRRHIAYRKTGTNPAASKFH
jgi:hypothetical protein